MANTSKCGSCEHYDPILRGMKETQNGWCVKRSLYPHKDSPGQITPANAQRVEQPHAPAKPYLVKSAGIVATCTLYTIRKPKISKADLLAQAMGGKR